MASRLDVLFALLRLEPDLLRHFHHRSGVVLAGALVASKPSRATIRWARSFHACSPRHRSASRGEHPSRALEPSRGTRRSPPGAFDPLRLETLDEGRCVQILHVGSYEDEAPMLRRLHEEYLPRNGFAPDGKHHEIHPGDVRRTPPAKLRTIIPRQPARVSKAGA